MSSIQEKKRELEFQCLQLDQYNNLVPTYNALLETKSRLNTIVYEISDYVNKSILPPAEDRAFLLQIGIAWPNG